MCSDIVIADKYCFLQVFITFSSHNHFTSSPEMIHNCWGEWCDVDAPFRTGHSTASYSLHINQWASVLIIIYYKHSLMKLRNALIYDYKDKDSGGSLILCLYNTTGSPPLLIVWDMSPKYKHKVVVYFHDIHGTIIPQSMSCQKYHYCSSKSSHLANMLITFSLWQWHIEPSSTVKVS